MSKPISFKPGSKKSQLLTLLKRPSGVSLKAIMARFKWLAHTTRGAIANLHTKDHLAIESFLNSDGDRLYRIKTRKPKTAKKIETQA